MYEIVPTGISDDTATLAEINLAYRLPTDTNVYAISSKVTADLKPFASSSDDHRFAAAVAIFGMSLRNSSYLKEGDISMAQHIAEKAQGSDPEGYRQEFLKLLKLMSKRKR
jgi:Ca-activated chloride channel family protein